MPALEHDRLVFRFPQIEEDASLSIDFQRTPHSPDSDRDYPLPPGFRSFPLRHVEDFVERLSAETATGAPLPGSQDVHVQPPLPLGQGSDRRRVRTSTVWE